MLRVGLTGGLAAGKSTVGTRLAELGAAVFDADAIVSSLYGPRGAGAEAARELFGEDVLAPSGEVDRSRVAAIVFSDPARRHALEARVHPLVRSEIERRFDQAERAGARVAVAEASQMMESGSAARYDRVLLVVAPEDERVRRWEASGAAAEDARRRIAAQISPAAAIPQATDVIVNDGTVEELRAKVDEVYARWLGE